MSMHTPGPWTTNGWADIGANRNGNPALVARAMQRSHDMPSHPILGAEADANAALIAAAPDLLDLAKDIAGLDHCYLAQGDKALQQALREWKAAARAAIAKAEGVS